MASSNEFLYYQAPPKPNDEGSNIINTSKVTRRRSRASKKTPTTHLNANTSNFRALVQQFTGCPSNITTCVSLKRSKGPVNLNFGLNTATPLVSHNDHNYAPKSQPLPQQKPHDQTDPLQDQQQLRVNYPFNHFISGDDFSSIHAPFQESSSHDHGLHLMEDEICWDDQLWSNDMQY